MQFVPSLSYPVLEARAKRDYYQRELSGEECEDLLRICNEAIFSYGARLMKPELLGQPESFYIGVAALDILKERYGPEFIREKLGIIIPKPFSKRVLDLVRRL